MKAMILAAGRGERMRPLTDTSPKPLLEVHGKPLIVHHIERLAAKGVRDIVINLAWLGEQIKTRLGTGRQFGVQIQYSEELNGALETAGGIAKALPLLGNSPFWVVNGDVFCDFNFTPPKLMEDQVAHLLLVDNPQHHLQGDFYLSADGLLVNKVASQTRQKLTYAGIGLYRPEFFQAISAEKNALAPWLRKFAEQGRISAQHHRGVWCDVGTPERLQQLNQN